MFYNSQLNLLYLQPSPWGPIYVRWDLCLIFRHSHFWMRNPDLALGSFTFGDAQPVADAQSVPKFLAVPVVQQSCIFGYFACSLDGKIEEFVSFCDTLTDIQACPMARIWLDQRVVVQTALDHVPQLQNIQQIFLSFDKTPNRLAWRVLGTDENDHPLSIFVMGMKAFETRH